MKDTIKDDFFNSEKYEEFRWLMDYWGSPEEIESNGPIFPPRAPLNSKTLGSISETMFRLIDVIGELQEKVEKLENSTIENNKLLEIKTPPPIPTDIKSL